MKEALRRVVRAVVTLGLRLRSRRYTPTPGGHCVIIAPHQDDETLGCAGLILAHRKAGLPVSIVYITDGSKSHSRHPLLSPADITTLRHAEAIHAMAHLGVAASSLHFLDAPDGGLPHLSPAEAEALVTRLSKQLRSLQPTELCLPCQADGSSEHVAAFTLTLRALQLAQLTARVLEYPIWARWSPQRLIRPGLTSRRVWGLAFPHAAAIKRTAIAAYASQTEPTPPWPQPVLPRGFVRCFDAPEEFFFER